LEIKKARDTRRYLYCLLLLSNGYYSLGALPYHVLTHLASGQ